MPLHKLGPRRLTETVDSLFSGIYLTLLSIIQSIALGFLATEVINVIVSVENIPLPRLLLLINTFFIIVIVWHFYLEGLLRRKWTPTIIDSLLPFSIGLVECVLVRLSTNIASWLLCLGVLATVGSIVNINALWQLKKEDLERESDYDALRSNLLYAIISWGIIGVILLPSLSFCVNHWPNTSIIFSGIVLVWTLITISLMLRKISWVVH